MNIQFREEQTFRKSWGFYLVLIVLAIPTYGLYKQVILDQPFGDKPMSDIGLIITLVFTVALVIFLWVTKLTTYVDKYHIQMNYFPLISKTIQWSDIKNAKVINYGFVGGWGIRLWTKYGTVYNTSGNKGLAIELNNGKKILIGTQKEKEFQLVIENISNPKQLDD